MTKKATYRILQFPVQGETRYVGMAWNYSQAVLMSTTDYSSYTEARAALQDRALELRVELRWFDGEYIVTEDQLEKIGDILR